MTNGSRPRSTTNNRGNGRSDLLGQTAKRLLACILDCERQHKQTHLPSGSLPGKQVRKYLSEGRPISSLLRYTIKGQRFHGCPDAQLHLSSCFAALRGTLNYEIGKQLSLVLPPCLHKFLVATDANTENFRMKYDTVSNLRWKRRHSGAGLDPPKC